MMRPRIAPGISAARRISRFLSWWVRGLAQPTPFFDDRTKAPRSVPLALTLNERAAPIGAIVE
jgi:hypothetical protein